MRNVSNAVAQLIENEASAVFLVKIQTPLTTALYTSAPFDLTVPTIGVFSSNSTLDKVEAPKLSDIVDREAYKIAFVDVDNAMRNLFESGITGSKIYVWVSFLNTLDTSINGKLPGEYLTDIDDLLPAYIGTIDTHGITIEPANGIVSATIEGASPVAALGMTRAITTSKEYIKQLNPNDNSFDQVFEDGARLPWGKIT